MAEDTEIPGSFRWLFLGGPKADEVEINQTGAPATIDGDEDHVYQLVTSPQMMPDATAAPDVNISAYQWTELHASADEVGGSYN